MFPAAESLLAAQEAAPSMLGATIRIALVIVAIAAGAWAWLYWQRRIKGPTRHLEILDRAMLARGASVALLRVGEKRLLVGVSAEGVRLLRDLEPGAAAPSGGSFSDVLSASLGATEGRQ